MQGFLKKAKDNLALAIYCLENGYYEAAANRAYYAAFQAAIAALAAQGSTNDKHERQARTTSTNTNGCKPISIAR